MALQVRRGTNAERLGITPLAGELVYTTDTKQLYVGDGATAGGITSIAGTIDSVLADTTPQLGGDLDLNSHNITGTGNINITGTITATGNINLGDGVGSDIVVFGGAIQGHLVPDTDITWNLGSPTKQFNEVWISQLNVENQLTVGRIMGDLIADDSTVVFDASTGLLAAAQLTGTLPDDVIPAAITSNITGDVIGSVFGDNSTLIVDGINNTVLADVSNVTTTSSTYTQGANIRTGGTGDGNIISLQDNASSAALIITTEDTAGLIVIPRPVQIGSSSSLIPNITITVPHGTPNSPGLSIAGSFDTAGNAFASVSRSRGTKAAPTAVQTGDALGAFLLTGYNGVAYRLAGGIRSIAAGAPQAAYIPANVELFVAGNSGSGEAALRVRRDQKVTELLGPMKLVPFTTVERDALTPEEGMVIFNTDTTIAQVYANSAWRDMNVAA